MTKEEAIKTLKENCCAMCAYGSQDIDSCDIHSCDNKDAIKALEQEQKIKVLNRDEVARRLGAVDIYQASAWIRFLNNLEFLGLKICEVEE